MSKEIKKCCLSNYHEKTKQNWCHTKNNAYSRNDAIIATLTTFDAESHINATDTVADCTYILVYVDLLSACFMFIGRKQSKMQVRIVFIFLWENFITFLSTDMPFVGRFFYFNHQQAFFYWNATWWLSIQGTFTISVGMFEIIRNLDLEYFFWFFENIWEDKWTKSHVLGAARQKTPSIQFM